MFITANTASQISWRKQHSLKERLALFKQSLQVLLQVPVSKVAACIIAEKPFDWIQRLLDAIFVHNVQPAIGSIVYCNLLIAVEHTGIYVGNNRIVHLDGEGIVKLVSTKEFCQRLGGFNPANTVFCPTDVNGKPIGSAAVTISGKATAIHSQSAASPAKSKAPTALRHWKLC